MGVRLCVCGLVGGRGRWLGPTRDTRAAARTTTPANTGLGPDLGRAGADWVPPPALFYVGSALLGSTFSVGLATMETFISKKVTQYADVVGDNVGKLMGVFYMALSAGRFAGPMIIGSITYIATPSGELGEGGVVTGAMQQGVAVPPSRDDSAVLGFAGRVGRPGPSTAASGHGHRPIPPL